MKTVSPRLQNVSRETFSPMADYVALLLKWNSKINLIGAATEDHIWSRHIEDSLQLVPLIPLTARSLIDLGSGAGLPGMVIAIQCPQLSVTLVEQDERKAAFLMEAKSRLGLLNVIIQPINIVQLAGTYDVVTARALAPLDNLLALAKPLLGQGATGLFPKGENYRAELIAACRNWQFQHEVKPSQTQGGASIITVSQLSFKYTENR